jgi:hypothetical protein
MIPPIPPRRLFAPPDSTVATNASTKGDPSVNSLNTLPGVFPSLTFFANPYLADPYAELITLSANPGTGDQWSNFVPNPPNVTGYTPSQMANTVTNQLVNTPTFPVNYKQQDFTNTGNRQTPYYRTELLQKVMNLTTVRTHQFAVWITVGFFEVTKVGTPELGIPDILGAELDAGAGRNVRYRSFFVIDRTKAAGFNPYYPGEFRNCVTYRRRIE